MMIIKSLVDILRQKNLLEPAVRATSESLELARGLTQETTDQLFTGREPSIDVYETDRAINRAEIEVRRMVFEHLVANGADHLVTSTILLTTISDVERIGDYAKNLHQQCARLKGRWPEGPVFDRIVALRDDLMPLFDDTISSIADGKKDLATSVMSRQADFSTNCENVVDELCAMKDARPCEVIVATLATRYMKRIAAHLKNLASSVVNPVDRIGYRPEPKAVTDVKDAG